MAKALRERANPVFWRRFQRPPRVGLNPARLRGIRTLAQRLRGRSEGLALDRRGPPRFGRGLSRPAGRMRVPTSDPAHEVERSTRCGRTEGSEGGLRLYHPAGGGGYRHRWRVVAPNGVPPRPSGRLHLARQLQRSLSSDRRWSCRAGGPLLGGRAHRAPGSCRSGSSGVPAGR